MDEDGLLAAGVPGVQLTWMDAKIGDWVVTPRIGKPVEIQALWLNALRIMGARLGAAGRISTAARWPRSSCASGTSAAAACSTWSTWTTCRAGTTTACARTRSSRSAACPAQVLVEPYATRVVETVERELLTPLGLRSLAPGEPGYRPRFGTSVLERDSGYHQGTVWPWLMGPFVEAWLRVRGNSPEAKRAADARFLAPLRAHLAVAGLGHVSEVADAEPPHAPGGCPFQAWSLGELLRASRLVEGERRDRHGRAPRRLRRLRRRSSTPSEEFDPMMLKEQPAVARLERRAHALRPRLARRAGAPRRGRRGHAALEAVGTRISASASGARCARTTAPTATPGTTSPHDQARSRAYRWGEDGIAGISDDQQRLCLALALWNGRDPILKERLFGLTNGEGNHGEDVKELYYYLDATPTHCYLKYLYKYPQAAFPYAWLVEENRRRGKDQPEFELLDTGVFDDDRYFDVVVEYAKAGPDDVLMRVTAHNRGPEAATLHLLPQLWLRNTWSWRANARRPRMTVAADGADRRRGPSGSASTASTARASPSSCSPRTRAT